MPNDVNHAAPNDFARSVRLGAGVFACVILAGGVLAATATDSPSLFFAALAFFMSTFVAIVLQAASDPR